MSGFIRFLRPLALLLALAPACGRGSAAPDGWAFHIVIADTSECPDTAVESALQAAGWAPAVGYSADGTDGTVMGFVTKRVLCVVQGQWDGGDDSDSTYVPQPGL